MEFEVASRLKANFLLAVFSMMVIFVLAGSKLNKF